MWKEKCGFYPSHLPPSYTMPIFMISLTGQNLFECRLQFQKIGTWFNESVSTSTVQSLQNATQSFMPSWSQHIWTTLSFSFHASDCFVTRSGNGWRVWGEREEKCSDLSQTKTSVLLDSPHTHNRDLFFQQRNKLTLYFIFYGNILAIYFIVY